MFESPGDTVGPFEIISLLDEFEQPVGVAVIWRSVNEEHVARFTCPPPTPTYLSIEAFFTNEFVAADTRTDRIPLSAKIDDESPRTISGQEHPNRHAILLSSNALPVGDISEQLYVSVTNYDGNTFLMKFEVGDSWELVRQYLQDC